MMRFNPNRFFHIGVFLALLAGGLGIGVLIGNGPSKSTRDKHADKMIRYKKARLSETKDRLRTETRIAENGLARGEKVSKPTAADNGRSGDGEQAEQDEKNIESVLSEIISYVEEEASPRKAGLLAELRYARDSGNVKMISNLLRRVALFNRNSKSGLAARNALAWLNGNPDLGGGLAGLATSGAQGGNGGGDGQVVAGGEADAGENVITDADQDDVMTFEEFEAMIKAKEALRNFQSELSNCGSEAERIGKIKAKMMTLVDKSSCNTLAMSLINSSDKAMAVRATVDLATSGNAACQESGKSAYQWLTGEKWAGAEAGMEQAAALEKAAALERSATYRED